jgi:TolB-like protein/Flp pilus assembly protein TadD
LAFFQELKRRNVFKVAISYVILAWLLLQVSDTLAPALRLPEWFQSGVAFMLILGFPVAVFFAWAFELTPDGLRRDAGAGSADQQKSAGGRNGLVIGLLVVALGYFVFDEFVVERQPATPPESEDLAVDSPEITDRTIAVLPFVDMSPDKDQEYMSDGISEELLNLLAKIPELDVTSRSSAFSFKGKDIDIPTIAAQLNVSYVLEGSVRKAENRIRITAQLIEAGNDRHLWSETFDRTLDDVFAIQDEISQAVVDALKITLLGEAPRVRAVDGQAYELALEARYFWNRRAPGDVERALKLYRQALEIEPDYALAWTGVSVALAVQALAGDIPQEEGLVRARAAAERALELDPMLADAHVRMGQAHVRARELDEALRSYERALELEPDNVLALGVMALYLRSSGQIDEAIPLLQRSAQLDPMGAIWHGNLASLLIQAGRYDDAIKALERTRELNPAARIGEDLALIDLLRGNAQAALERAEALNDRGLPEDVMIAIYQELGMQEQSDDLLAGLERNDDPTDASRLPGAYAARGEIDKAYRALEGGRPFLQGRRGSVEYDPILRRYMSDDPGWRPFLQSLEAID